MHARSIATPRRVRRRIATLAAVLTTIVSGQTTLAQAPEIVPTYAYVREADPVVFLRAPNGPSLAGVTGVGARGSERLTVAWFEADEDRLTVSFRLAGETSATLGGLVVMRDGETTDLMAGGTIAPALLVRSERLQVPYELHAPGEGIVGAGIVESLSPDPMTLRRIDLVPVNGIGVAGHVHQGPGARDAFEAWIGSLTASMMGLAAPLPPGSTPEPDFPRRLAQHMSESEAEIVWLDPSAAELTLPPGASLFWAVTPASFPTDVRGASVTVAPRFVFDRDDGACCEVVPSAGLFAMSWLP